MEGSESSEGSGSRGSSHLGVNKAHSAKISKVVKRSVIQPPKPQAPVYTIDKNDFRNIVQKLTGSPSPTPPPVSSSPSPPPPITSSNTTTSTTINNQSSRLQRVRPPPLQSVQSFNKLVSNLTPMNTNIPPQSLHNYHHNPLTSSDNFTNTTSSSSSSSFVGGNNFSFRPTFRFPTPPQQFSSPFQLPQPSNFNISSSFSRPPPLMGPPPPPPQPMLSSQPQFLAFSPLPSPSSQYQIHPSFSGSQVPFSPGSIFPLSPSGHFGYPALPPPSPGSFPLSPGQFPFTSF